VMTLSATDRPIAALTKLPLLLFTSEIAKAPASALIEDSSVAETSTPRPASTPIPPLRVALRMYASTIVVIVLREPAPAPAMLIVVPADGPPEPAAIAPAIVRASIVAVDGALAGVFVPAGTHTVTLDYLPRSFLAGGAVTAGATLAAGVVLVGAARRREPDRAHE